MSSIRIQLQSKKQKEAQLSDDKIDQLIKDITLKRPRNSYTQFVIREIEAIKSKNKGKKIDLLKLTPVLIEKWKKLKDSERRKYTNLYEEEKVKFKADLEMVRHLLFKDYNDIIHRPPTAFRIFLNEKLRNGFDQGIDPKEVKNEATKQWHLMSEEERNVYYDTKRENDNWFAKAEKINKINPIALFIQKKMEEAKEKHQEPPALKDIAPAWKKLSKKEKKAYEKYAQDLNEEKKKLQDIYEIAHGIKPKAPSGAFRIFIQENAKNNEGKSIVEWRKMWNKLSEEEKDEYLKKSHRCNLAYRYKMMIYNKKIKKILPKKPQGPLQQFLKEKKGQKPPKGENWLIYWRTVYDNLSNNKKKKYEDKAIKAKEIYEKKMAQFQGKVFDMPKNPLSSFALYVKDRIPDIKKERPKISNAEALKQAAKEWQKGKGVDKNQYKKEVERDKIRFQKQLKEFHKFGYYTKTREEIDEDEEDGRKIIKKKSVSVTKAISQQKSKKKNIYTNSNSKKENQRIIWKNRSIQKVGKPKKSKK